MTATANGYASEPSIDVRAEVLVTPGWLAAHLPDPGLRVVEVDVSSKAYTDWHIDGAVLWDIYRDFRDADYRTVSTLAVQQLLERSGIGPESTVVFYGYAPALAFWLMKLYGHADARILDCSRDTWQAEGRPSSDQGAQPAVGSYRLGESDHRIRADREAVRGAIGLASTRLVDVRSAAEYQGERFWPSGGLDPNGRAGHIPSAIHQPIDGLYDERGAFLPTPALHQVLSPIDLVDDRDLITYCTVGARAATAWFVLTCLLGSDRVRVYDGSWAEWGRTAECPVEAP